MLFFGLEDDNLSPVEMRYFHGVAQKASQAHILLKHNQRTTLGSRVSHPFGLILSVQMRSSHSVREKSTGETHTGS